MTTRLILIRHAESGWDDPFADDHARVLTNDGRTSATAVGNWLAHNGYVPDVILCSDAARTVETMDRVTASFDRLPMIVLDKMLYHPSPDTILEQARKRTEAAVAVVAHNPGIGMVADAVLTTRPNHRRFLDYPSGAVTVIDFDGKPDFSKGRLVDFVVPSDLNAYLP